MFVYVDIRNIKIGVALLMVSRTCIDQCWVFIFYMSSGLVQSEAHTQVVKGSSL